MLLIHYVFLIFFSDGGRSHLLIIIPAVGFIICIGLLLLMKCGSKSEISFNLKCLSVIRLQILIHLNQLIVWFIKHQKTVKRNVQSSISCQLLYFSVSFLLYDSKLSIFGLWTKLDIGGCHLGLWETVINIFHNFRNNLRK